MWKHEDKKKEKIPSYLQNHFSFKNRVKRFFDKLFHPGKYNGTIEQEKRNNKRKYSSSSSYNNTSSKSKNTFSWTGEFDLVRFLWVVIPTVLLISSLVFLIGACSSSTDTTI